MKHQELPWVCHGKIYLPTLTCVTRSYAYINDEGTNLNIVTNALTNIMSCVTLMLPQPYASSCYGHVMLKCCQYATNNLKVYGSMKEVYMHVSLQKNYYMDQKKKKGNARMGKSL